jgi:hypothetical protein
LKQRVALRCLIEPFDLSGTAAYIATRIKVAGGVPSKLFTREGVSLIHEHSGGIPRTISVICDNALVSGMALDRQPVDRGIVLEVCRDFHLRQDASLDTTEPVAGSEDSPDAGANVPEEREPTPVDVDSDSEQFGPAPKPRRFTFLGSGRR